MRSSHRQGQPKLFARLSEDPAQTRTDSVDERQRHLL
jgi:hypothetical protein